MQQEGEKEKGMTLRMEGDRETNMRRDRVKATKGAEWAENVPGRAALSDVAFFVKWKIYFKSSSTECFSGRAHSKSYQALGCPREE